MKKGQSALEYLVTYGWAILAIVIIAAVMWYFGIFNPQSFAGSKQCTGFTSFVCQDFKVNSSGWVTLVLNNKVGNTINAVNITTGTAGWICSPTTVSPNANTTCRAILTLNSGAVGDTVDGTQISLSFTDSKSSLSHTDTGTIRGKVE